MKRTPIRRKTGLRRNAIQRAIDSFKISHRSMTKHARRPRAFDFMGWVKRQPCTVALAFEALHRHVGYTRGVSLPDLKCEGAVEADHAGNRFRDGDGTRAFDRTCIPLCSKHHRQRTDYRGIFSNFTSGMMRDWCDEAVRLTHGLARAAGIEIPTC